MLAEPADPAVLVEVRPGGGAAPRSGPAGASGLSPTALGLRRPRCLAPQHHPSAFPFLQVCKKYARDGIAEKISVLALILREMLGDSDATTLW